MRSRRPPCVVFVLLVLCVTLVLRSMGIVDTYRKSALLSTAHRHPLRVAEVRILVELVPTSRGARILRLFHPGLELGTQFVLRRRVRRLPGEVSHLGRIRSQIVEFLRRPLLEREREKICELRFAAVPQDELLARRCVAIAIWADGLPHLRVATRPAVWPQIADIEKVLPADRAGWIAQIARAHVRVALAFDENAVALLAVVLSG